MTTTATPREVRELARDIVNWMREHPQSSAPYQKDRVRVILECSGLFRYAVEGQSVGRGLKRSDASGSPKEEELNSPKVLSEITAILEGKEQEKDSGEPGVAQSNSPA